MNIEQSLQNIEAEAALLGAMMVNNGIIDRILDKVQSDDFYEPMHGRIFTTISNYHLTGKQANPVTLAPYLAADPAIQAVGGVGYLAKLTGSGATLIGAYDFAEQIAELSQRRMIVENLQGIIARAGMGQSNMADLIAEAEESISQTMRNTCSSEATSLEQSALEIIEEQGQEVSGISCPAIPDANFALGLIEPGNLIIVGGRPGMGKSSFASSYALGVAKAGDGVLYVNLEMSKPEMAERALADLCFHEPSQSGIPYLSIVNRHVRDSADIDRMFAAKDALSALPFKAVTTGRMNVPRLSGLVRAQRRRFEASGTPLRLIIVDYLQLLESVSPRSNRVDQVGEISRGLKMLAGSEGVAVIALCQLSRAVEAREDKRPHLSDLRESGSIEQDADIVMFLYRHEYYLEKMEPERGTPKHLEWQDAMDRCRNVLDLIAAKKRRGRVGSYEARFYAKYSAVRGRPQ